MDFRSQSYRHFEGLYFVHMVVFLLFSVRVFRPLPPGLIPSEWVQEVVRRRVLLVETMNKGEGVEVGGVQPKLKTEILHHRHCNNHPSSPSSWCPIHPSVLSMDRVGGRLSGSVRDGGREGLRGRPGVESPKQLRCLEDLVKVSLPPPRTLT